MNTHRAPSSRKPLRFLKERKYTNERGVVDLYSVCKSKFTTSNKDPTVSMLSCKL